MSFKDRQLFLVCFGLGFFVCFVFLGRFFWLVVFGFFKLNTKSVVSCQIFAQLDQLVSCQSCSWA